jgi:hypothetical protein
MLPNEDCPLCKERFVETVADVLLEKERIVEFLRSSAQSLEENPIGGWSTAQVENEASTRILKMMAKLIEDGSWVETFNNQQEVRRRAAMKVAKVVDLASYGRKKP